MGAERRRLQRLEEAAAKLEPTPTAGRTRPSDRELKPANTIDGYYGIWERHGWTRCEVEAHEEWRELVERRCDAAGYEEWQTIGDMVKWFENTGLPHHEMGEALLRYPGPGFWAQRGEGGP